MEFNSDTTGAPRLESLPLGRAPFIAASVSDNTRSPAEANPQ